jgi:hypothetical protein
MPAVAPYQAGSPTADALKLLASWAATQDQPDIVAQDKE